MKKKKLNKFKKDAPSRTIILNDDITSKVVGRVIEDIVSINEYDDFIFDEDSKYEPEPIKLITSTFGGSIYDGFALIPAIELSNTPIHTYCYGYAMSMGLLIFSCGDKRFMHNMATLMYHECLISNIPESSITSIKDSIAETERLMSMYDTKFLSNLRDVKNNGLTKDFLDEIKRRRIEHYFNAEDALKYGIIDEII